MKICLLAVIKQRPRWLLADQRVKAFATDGRIAGWTFDWMVGPSFYRTQLDRKSASKGYDLSPDTSLIISSLAKKESIGPIEKKF